MDSLQAFFGDLKVWGADDSAILRIALIGSHARGSARPDSDIDVIVVVNDPVPYLDDSGWAGRFGTPLDISREDWGLVQSARVHYDDGKHVEFGFTTPAWVRTNPVDADTAKVAAGGLMIVCDPQGLLLRLLAALTSM